MNARTPEEVKAYVDGYNACYRDFVEYLKEKPYSVALEKMEMLKVAVDNTYEIPDEEAIEHAIAIQKFCKYRDRCNGCPFEYIGCCIFTHVLTKTPERWNIEEKCMKNG